MAKVNPAYYSAHVARKILNVTAQTLRNWDKRGVLKPHHTSENGYRYYRREDIDSFRKDEGDKLTIGYCRVASRKQKDELERQVENVRMYLMAKGKPFRIIEDIGSGINYKKKGLLGLISLVESNAVEKVVVLYKDRLLRFGFDLLEAVFAKRGCAIEVIDSTERTEEQELAEDLVQIVSELSGCRPAQARELVDGLLGK